MHSSAKEHQEAYDVPAGLLYFHDASVAEYLPKDLFQINPDVYYAIVGDDGDFLIGGDIAKLDFRPQLRGLNMPVLVVTGRYDRVSVPRFSLKFKQYAPQAEIVMFEHSGHSPFIEEPDAFFAALRRFLGGGLSEMTAALERGAKQAVAAGWTPRPDRLRVHLAQSLCSDDWVCLMGQYPASHGPN